MDDVFAQVEERVAGVAGLHPCREAREVAMTLHEHSLAADAVEGVREIKEEGPVLVALQECHQLGGSMYDGFTTSLVIHSKLQRGELRNGGRMHEGGEALRNQPSQHLPDGNGAMASIPLPACKEGGTTEVWGDGGCGTTRRQQVEESGEGREEPVSPVWGGTAHCLTEVAWAESRRSRGRTVGE